MIYFCYMMFFCATYAILIIKFADKLSWNNKKFYGFSKQATIVWFDEINLPKVHYQISVIEYDRNGTKVEDRILRRKEDEIGSQIEVITNGIETYRKDNLKILSVPLFLLPIMMISTGAYLISNFSTINLCFVIIGACPILLGVIFGKNIFRFNMRLINSTIKK